jgi:hypothetical protein
VLKEDFLQLYLDPYYDLIQLSLGNPEREQLRISLTKKKKQLKQFQNSQIDYYSSPLKKEWLIQRYLEETVNTEAP